MSTKIVIEVTGGCECGPSTGEIQRLRAALEPFATLADQIGHDVTPDYLVSFRAEYLLAARAALRSRA